MQDLLKRLQDNAGINEQQSEKVLETIRDFIAEKFPMFAGAVDNLLGDDAKDEDDPLA